jgi:hypothetical protein
MVVAEADQRADREVHHLCDRTGPDAGHHGQQIPVAKRRAETILGQEVPDRLFKRCLLATLRQLRAQAVEAQQIGQHAIEVGPQQIAPLHEHAVQIAAAPLELVLSALHRERHIAGRHLDAELFEQRDQQRIAAFVEDQKAGVDAVAPALQLDVNRVGMSAEISAGLEKRDPRPCAECPGGRQAGDARTDDGHPATGV